MHARAAPRRGAGAPLALLAWLFLRVGCASFGGFMTMVSVTRTAVVERRRLLGEQELLDGLTLASVLPGPLAVNLVAYVGYRLRGGAGAAVCVLAAVAPAFLFMLALSALYFRAGRPAALEKVFMAVTPAVAAIILASAWRMARASVGDWREAALALATAALLLAAPGPLSSIAAFAAAGLVGRRCFAAAAPADGAPAQPQWPSLLLFALSLALLLRYRLEAIWIVPGAGLIGFLLY